MPHLYPLSSIKRWGGSVEGYLPIHTCSTSPSKSPLTSGIAPCVTTPRVFSWPKKSSA